jgi:plastocyanin
MRPFHTMPALLIALAACGGGGSEPPATVASLTVSPPTPDTLFARGATLQLNVVARDANNATIGNPQLTFTSANQNAATVNAAGLVTAQNDGKTNVTVQSGGVSEVVEVNVRRRVTNVAVTPSPHSFAPGQTQQFTAAPRDANNNAIAGLTGEFTSSNTAAVEITTGGLATAKAVGTSTVTATFTTVDGVRTGTSQVTVETFPTTASVILGASTFNPATVNIAASGTVTWNNTSGLIHNVTFSSPTIADIPDHPTTANPSQTNQRSFPTAGTFGYSCTIHPGMNGSVVVH